MEIKFISKANIVGDIWEFRFSKPSAFLYQAGDYVDFTVPNVAARMLSMSSNPRESELIFTMRIVKNSSAFKQALSTLKPDNVCLISPAIGNFNLPIIPKPILFIAIGIGITPYRSLLLEESLPEDSRLIYTARAREHIYEDIITKSKIDYTKREGRLQLDQIAMSTPDFKQRIIYLAGPEPACVKLYAELLQAGLKRSQIKLEYFPGYKPQE